MRISLANLAVFVAAAALAAFQGASTGERWWEVSPVMLLATLFLVGLVAEAACLSQQARSPEAPRTLIGARFCECVLAAFAILLSQAIERLQPTLATLDSADTYDRVDWVIRGLAFGGMLLAMPSIRRPRHKASRGRRRLLQLLFWPAVIYLGHRLISENWMLVTALVDIALEGIESSQPITQYAADSGSLYAGLDANITARASRFFPVCLFALVPIGFTGVIFAQFLLQGSQTRFSHITAVLLVLGLLASSWFPFFLLRGGLREYSPPMAESTFPLQPFTIIALLLLSLMLATLVSRVAWQRGSGETRSLVLRSSHLYHRAPGVLLLVFVAWLMLLAGLAYEYFSWASAIDVAWFILADPKFWLLTAVGFRALGLAIGAWAGRADLLELVGVSCRWRRYVGAVAASTALFVLSAPAITWGEYALTWYWMRW